MDIQDDDRNLTERLFNGVKKATETSAISNRNAATFDLSLEPEVHLIDGDHSLHWYRLLRRLTWAWQGADPIEVDGVLAKIAGTDSERTHPGYLDTIKGFTPGNWVFEWCQIAGRYLKQGRESLATGNQEQAQKELLRAARYYSIGSYPHLKRDELADQAQLLGNIAYREAGRLFNVPLKEIQIPYKGRSIQGYLHLPAGSEPKPLVIVSGNVDSLQLDYYQLFLRYLEPAGIAMLSLDMPGIGYSEPWPLEEDSSCLHQQAVEYMAAQPMIDGQRIGMIGFRLGGNIAARLAFLLPNRIKAVVCIGAGVNLCFNDPRFLAKYPRMLRDSMANRLGADAADWDILGSKTQVFSLKRQGLLGTKTPVPILAIGHEEDFICPPEDLRALATSSRGGRALIYKKESLWEVYEKGLVEAANWLKEQFSISDR